MTTEGQLELEEIKKLIGDRFDKQEEKINARFDKQEEKINARFDKQDEKISDIRIKLAEIKVDTTWIKWLFSGLLSFILILLSVIITVIFKLVS